MGDASNRLTADTLMTERRAFVAMSANRSIYDRASASNGASASNVETWDA
jgi:hypothetical protein